MNESHPYKKNLKDIKQQFECNYLPWIEDTHTHMYALMLPSKMTCN